jgi:hypothetical protein
VKDDEVTERGILVSEDKKVLVNGGDKVLVTGNDILIASTFSDWLVATDNNTEKDEEVEEREILDSPSALEKVTLGVELIVPTAEFRPVLAGSINMKPADSKYATGLDWLSTPLSRHKTCSRSGLLLATELKINAHIVINCVSFLGKKWWLLTMSIEVKPDNSEHPIGLDWLIKPLPRGKTWSRSGLSSAIELKSDAHIVKNLVSVWSKWWSFRRLEVLGWMISLDTSCFATFSRTNKLQCSFIGKVFGKTIKRDLALVRRW